MGRGEAGRAMSYRTVQVELENGQVRATGEESLPARAHALLTILDSPTIEQETKGESLAARVEDLAGIGNGIHTDLSCRKAHLDDFGR